MPKTKEVQAQALRESRLADTISRQFADELARVVRRLESRLATMLGRIERGGHLAATKSNIGFALRLRSDLVKELDRAGYGRLVRSSSNLDRLTKTILKGRSTAATSARLTALDRETLAAVREMNAASLLRLGEELNDTLSRSVLNGIVGARSVDELVDELHDLIGVTERRARSLYDTAVSVHGRHVDQVGTTGEAGELFLYAGPRDGLMRPFCRHLIGKVKTREQIAGLSNGQLPNVLLTGGGWNCRHAWKPVSELDEELRARAEAA